MRKTTKKKKMLKFASTLLAAAVVLSSQMIVSSALVSPQYRGDVNLDGSVTVTDVTEIQRYLVYGDTLSKRQLFAAEVDGDDVITVKDVTMVQKYCVGLISSFNTKPAYIHTVSVKNFCADFSSGKAMAGTAVTFCAEASGGVEPFSYEFFVDDTLIQERSENNFCTYTFDEAGTYTVSVKMYNDFDEYVTYTTDYVVTEPYTSDSPVITAVYLNRLSVCDQDTNTVVTANAIFGTAPYEYSFSLDDGELTQDFSESNEFVIAQKLSAGEHTVKVSVKDSANNTAATENYTFFVEEAMP